MRRDPIDRRAYVIVLVIAFALYALTASRGAQWQDSGWQIWRAVTGELSHPRGLALVHPLHHWIARWVARLGVVEPCFAITLISAVAAAITVANVFGCVVTMTRGTGAALLAAASLGIAHTFWKTATITETYTLSTALLSAECWCLVLYALDRRGRWLCLMALCNGLGVANHLLAALTTPVILFLVGRALHRKELRIAQASLAGLLWLVGSLPYTGLVLLELLRTGDPSGTLSSALFGTAYRGNVLNTALSARLLWIGAGFFVLNFPNLLLPAAAYGITRRMRLGPLRLAHRALAVELLIHACFAVRYNVVDQYMFFLPMYVLLVLFGGAGFAALRHGRRRREWLVAAVAALAVTPVMYLFVPALARRLGVLQGVAQHKPYRDDYAYLFTPWSVTERSADRMSRAALRLAGPHGLILVEDRMAAFAIRYQVRREAGDGPVIALEIAPEQLRRAAREGRSVVLVPRNVNRPPGTPPVGQWKRAGDLYVLSTDAGPP